MDTRCRSASRQGIRLRGGASNRPLRCKTGRPTGVGAVRGNGNRRAAPPRKQGNLATPPHGYRPCFPGGEAPESARPVLKLGSVAEGTNRQGESSTTVICRAHAPCTTLVRSRFPTLTWNAVRNPRISQCTPSLKTFRHRIRILPHGGLTASLIKTLSARARSSGLPYWSGAPVLMETTPRREQICGEMVAGLATVKDQHTLTQLVCKGVRRTRIGGYGRRIRRQLHGGAARPDA